jgi:aspartate-semialdehyde dehydrogenase
MPNKDKYKVCIVGSTGAVGREMLAIVEERNLPLSKLVLFSSSRSAGKTLDFKGEQLTVQELTENSFDEGFDIGLFSAGGSISEKYAPIAGARGVIVIDNTSAFRMDPQVPLIVPEVNPDAVADYTVKNIIANPNCSTIQMVVALKPIYDAVGIKRIVVSSYQATSGGGQSAMQEMIDQTSAVLNQKPVEVNKFAHQIAFNVLPHIDKFLDNGYTKEEMKMVNETRKIFGDAEIGVTATTVRVPVRRGHSEAINVETREKLTADACRKLLGNAPGVLVVDDPAAAKYPLAIEASGRDETFVGRIREDESIANGLNLWVVSDNLRKGAALNAVQIAELLIEKYI